MNRKLLIQKISSASKKVLDFLSSKEFRYIIFAWFVFSASWMAVSTKKSIPPDEGNHYRSIIMFKEAGVGSFVNLQHVEAWRLQGASRTPNYMYHYVMSYPMRLMPGSFSDQQKVTILRFTSIIFSLLGLIVISKAFDLATKTKWVTNLSLLMITNTIMFPFISASLNYDGLAFLVTASLTYFFIRLIKKYSLADLIAFATVGMFGSMVKFQILPLVAILGFFVVLHHAKNYREIYEETKVSVKKNQRKVLLLSVPFIIMFGLFFERYGMNYIKYGTYRPACDQVISYDDCTKNGLFVRNMEFKDNPVDPPIPPVSYIADWVNGMKKNMYSILGHKRTKEIPVLSVSVAIIWAAMTLAVIIKFDKKNKLVIYMLVSALIYAAILLMFNYGLFAKSGRNLARQGRYLFPVLGMVYFVGLHHLSILLKNKQNILAASLLGIAVVFFLSSWPAYIIQTNSSWHTKSTRQINRQLRQLVR